jgi:hypothetical protein
LFANDDDEDDCISVEIDEDKVDANEDECAICDA